MTTKTKNTEVSRALNLGKEITLKSGDTITVRELTLDQTLKILNDLLSVAGKFDDLGGGDETTFMRKLLLDDDLRVEIERIASACTGMPMENLKTLGLSDWLRIIATIKEVLDWEELKELFFQVVPKAVLQKAIPVQAVMNPQTTQSQE